MAKHIKQKDANGNVRKVNVIIEEYKDADGVTVHKINPELLKKQRNNLSFEQELLNAIAMFEKTLRLRSSSI